MRLCFGIAENLSITSLTTLSKWLKETKIIKSARNIANLKVIEQEGANAYDILKYKNVIFTTSSIKSFQDRVSK